MADLTPEQRRNNRRIVLDYDSHKATTRSPDTLSAEGFAALLRESKTSLVVLATCKALLLAVDVAHVANMAASDADITGEAAAEWEECFYGLLAKGLPLFKAFDMSKSLSNTPIRSIRNRDVAFAIVDQSPQNDRMHG